MNRRGAEAQRKSRIGQRIADNGVLRVLFALPGLHRVHRGAEVALEEIARRSARDHEMSVTVIGSGPPRAGEPYRYRRAACIDRGAFEHFPRVPYARDPYAWEELSFAPGLWRSYAPRSFDLTVTCGYPYTNWVLRSRRGRGGRPLHVFVTQNGDWMVRARNSEFRHFHCDALVCTNPEYFERHRNRYRCALIPNGVDTVAFHPSQDRPRERSGFGLSPDRPVILIVGALIPSKRPGEAVRAAAAVADAQIIVVGDGPERDEIDTLGQALAPGRYRRLALAPDRMPDLYRCGDALLHLSREEAFGNIYIEALASGIPIVAHDTITTRWIFEDQGHLLDTSDLPAVTAALRRALDDRSPQRIAARRAIAEKRFAWPAVARQYCEFFREVHAHAQR